MQSRRIIVASAHLMDGTLKLGSSHIARTLAEAGHQVLYLNHPTSWLHLLHPRSRAASRRRLAAAKAKATATPGLMELTPVALLPHLPARGLRGSFTLQHWHQLTMPRIEGLIAKAGFADADLILFDTVMFWPLVERLGIPSVYRVADRIEGFDVNTAAMIGLHRKAVKEASFVLHTAADLAPPEERAKPSRHIPNGVQYDLFQAKHDKPAEYAGFAGPIIVYVGAIESWFDIPGVAEAARSLPHASFVVIGPVSPELDMSSLQNLPNVHLLGPRRHAAVPAYLQHADIGIIPFNLNTHGRMLDSVSPLKLFEYFACGLPSVCYGGEEVRRLAAPATLYDPRSTATGLSHPTLSSALTQAISALPTTEDGANRLRAYARAADWRQRVGELMRLLEEQGIISALRSAT